MISKQQIIGCQGGKLEMKLSIKKGHDEKGSADFESADNWKSMMLLNLQIYIYFYLFSTVIIFSGCYKIFVTKNTTIGTKSSVNLDIFNFG